MCEGAGCVKVQGVYGGAHGCVQAMCAGTWVCVCVKAQSVCGGAGGVWRHWICMEVQRMCGARVRVYADTGMSMVECSTGPIPRGRQTWIKRTISLRSVTPLYGGGVGLDIGSMGINQTYEVSITFLIVAMSPFFC